MYRGEKYKGYRIVREPSPVYNDCNVWVHNLTGVGETYLQIDGTTYSSARDGWFDSEAHAKQVIDNINKIIHIGGE